MSAQTQSDTTHTNPAGLSPSMQDRLNSYATSATAAGVAMLALTLPTRAEAVFTPSNLYLKQRVGINLDLNHDKVADFLFQDGRFCLDRTTYGCRYSGAAIEVFADRKSNQVEVSHSQPVALPPGATVGPGQSFQNAQPGGKFLTVYSNGVWKAPTRAYLGLKFTIQGEVHYGWAAVYVPKNNVGYIEGYAYETEPDTAIITGPMRGAFQTGEIEGQREKSPGALAAGEHQE